MFSRILVAAFLTVLSLPAYCQSPPAMQTTAVPDYVLYDRFLYRVTWFETQANNLKAQGKSDAFMRSWMRLHAGLTTQEETTLKAVAADCEAQTSATMSAARALVAAGANPSTSSQVQALLSQRQQTVQGHMGQLQSAYGALRYAMLDAFARKIVQFGAGPAVPAVFVPKPPAAVVPPK
jgi:hypothetical protein